MPILGHIYPWDTEAHIIWHIPILNDPYSVFTNILTLGQLLPLMPSQSCMHMGTCAKGRFSARARKAILYKIVERLEKIKQATQMSSVLSTLHIVLVRGSFGPWLRERALAPRPFWPNFRGVDILSNDHVMVRIELRGAIVELATKLKKSGAIGLVSMMLSRLCPSYQAHKVSVCARFGPWVFRAQVCPKTTPKAASPKEAICPCERGMKGRQRRET